MKKIVFLAFLFLIPQFAFAGSQTYSTPGSYTFTVPPYKTLTITVNGAGGGAGGAGPGGYHAASDGGPGGSTTILSQHGYGGLGGQGSPATGGPPAQGAAGQPGGADGGDPGFNIAGGGASGGTCDGVPYMEYWYPATKGGTGGAGGQSVKVYQSGGVGAPTAGTSVNITIGAGGYGGAANNWSPGTPDGRPGQDGSVIITWTDPNCTVSIDRTPDSNGFSLLAGIVNRWINKLGFSFCVSNASGLSYFIPAKTTAELQSFFNAIPRLSGVSQMAP